MTTDVRARLTKEEARAALRDLPAILAGRLPDPTGVVERTKTRLAEELLRLVRERFDALSSGGTWGGAKWKALAPSTEKRKRRKGPPLVLRDTGALYASLVAEVTGRGVSVSAPVPHAVHAHRERPLWPDPPPPEWREALLRVVGEGARDLAAALVRRAAG